MACAWLLIWELKYIVLYYNSGFGLFAFLHVISLIMKSKMIVCKGYSTSLMCLDYVYFNCLTRLCQLQFLAKCRQQSQLPIAKVKSRTFLKWVKEQEEEGQRTSVLGSWKKVSLVKLTILWTVRSHLFSSPRMCVVSCVNELSRMRPPCY